MNPSYCVLISVYDKVQQVVAKHPVTLDPNLLEFNFTDTIHYFKEYEKKWQAMLPEGCSGPIVGVEIICSHSVYVPEDS